jgi:cytoskeletal protein RodZ
MRKQQLSLRFGAMWLVGLLFVSLFLAACGGGSEEEAAPTAAETEEVAAAVTEETAAQEEPVTEATEESAVSQAPATTEVTPSGPAECEAIEIPDYEPVAAVTENDWSQGPADAPLTLIEYGDFQ